MYEQMEKELNFGYRKTGSFVLAFNEEENEKLDEIYHKGIKNGVEGLALIDGDKARQMEPHLSKAVTKALYLSVSYTHLFGQNLVRHIHSISFCIVHLV